VAPIVMPSRRFCPRKATPTLWGEEFKQATQGRWELKKTYGREVEFSEPKERVEFLLLLAARSSGVEFNSAPNGW